MWLFDYHSGDGHMAKQNPGGALMGCGCLTMLLGLFFIFVVPFILVAVFLVVAAASTPAP